MLASMLTGIPFSFTAHAYDIYSNDVDLEHLRGKIEQAKFVVTVSGYNRDFLVRRLGTPAADKVCALHNGVDLQRFSPDPGVKRDDGLVLAVGRLIEKKGFSSLIEACHTLLDRGHRFRCEIVGDGELRGCLEQQVRDLRLTGIVKLVGSRSQEELLTYYRRATVVVLPAVVAGNGDRDALPTVLLEAMACGAPVVASRLTGIPEIVDSGLNGLLVESGDTDGLGRAIDRLLVAPDLREQFGISARAKAERCFDLRENVTELRGLLDGAARPAELIEVESEQG